MQVPLADLKALVKLEIDTQEFVSKLKQSVFWEQLTHTPSIGFLVLGEAKAIQLVESQQVPSPQIGLHLPLESFSKSKPATEVKSIQVSLMVSKQLVPTVLQGKQFLSALEKLEVEVASHEEPL